MSFSRKDKKIFGIVLFSVGIPFTIAGVIITLLVPSFIQREGNEVANLPVVDVETIQNSIPINEKVIIEGTVDDRNKIISDQIPLVAYQEYVRDDIAGNEGEWRRKKLVNPSLLIGVPDGLVKLEAGYYINQRSTAIRVNKRQTYSGFAINDPIFIIAVVTNNELEIPTLKGEIVTAAGNKGEYLESIATNVTIFRILGYGFIIIGVIMNIVAVMIISPES